MSSTNIMTSPDQDATPPRKPLRNRRWFRVTTGLAVAFVAFVVFASVTNHPSAVAAKPAPRVSQSAPVHPATHAPAKHAKPTTAPASSAPATPAAPVQQQPAAPAPAAPVQAPPAAPAGPTVSQQQALTSAQGYLSDGQGFSRLGLIQQLSSSAGEGFSVADATWAVDNSGADWNAQAVMSAKGYMADGQGFSRQGLIDQLTSSAGEQFTYAQATYAVGKVGL